MILPSTLAAPALAAPSDAPSDNGAPDGAGPTAGTDGDDDPAHGHTHPGPDLPAELSDGALAEVVEEIERLRESAAEAAGHHETIRRREERQRAALERVRERLAERREKAEELRVAIGRQAGKRYREGNGSGLARLVLADSPEELLSEADLIGRGELSARHLLEELEETERRLAHDEASAEALHRVLTRLGGERRSARRTVERDLARAEERLEELEEARAEAARRAAGEARETLTVCPVEGEEPTGTVDTGAGEAPDPARIPGDDAGGAGADAGETAEPAVDTPWTAPLPADAGAVPTAGFGADGERWAAGHSGQDFAVPEGTDVLAVGSGVVVAVECDDAYGLSVVLRHDNGYHSQYAHLSVVTVEPGARVGTGRRVGLSGNTGNSTGPHLHFEIRLTPHYGSAVEPMGWLRDHGVSLG
ncbi:M23 family metallopeptidase [Streptomyces sp. ST2-7A]|uniref:M23 family metallopeptidase n=1 Tax=Streptomyces sp. ST2-7A TaxID=2907214 RepID=UPI001F31741E|nr:M23 family metallopeptidase [Streptomyces sp. ST2-7A]MCE7083326.1 M23 family metallopeptidase [Streptomyces sp. ST2-7A]